MLAPVTTSLCARPFAALGRAGRPRTVAAAAAAPATEAPAAAKAEKKPASAYALFMKQVFPQVKASNPDADFAKTSRLVSEQWKTLDATKKQGFLAAAASAKAQWDAKQPPKAPKVKAPLKVKVAKVDKPKRPATGYALFVKNNFQQFAKRDQSAPETMKVLSVEWKKLSEAQKAKYK